MKQERLEHDSLGEVRLAATCLWGIQTERSRHNFPLAGRPVQLPLWRAFGEVKLACARTNHALGYLTDAQVAALTRACEELRDGALDSACVVDALQGGAGTSTNMNVNEVLANRALIHLGKAPGEYAQMDPLEHVNLHQSTNDTYPTALRIAAMRELLLLDQALTALVAAFESKEHAFADVVKIGRTEMQDAVPITLGREMGAYAEALARDRWRLSKCQERLRVVNLGGGAIGTGLGAPRAYILRVVDELRKLSQLPVARADNLLEATQNQDALVECMGLLKTCASTLLKISGDLRLMSSGPECGLAELRLPPRQAGSSMMPGKVNPVIPEAVSQVALRVFAHDQTVAYAVGLSALELCQFTPLVAESFLESIRLLTQAVTVLRTHCIEGLTANRERCAAEVRSSTALATLLSQKLGYHRAAELTASARAAGLSVHQAALEYGWLSQIELDELVLPERLNQLGFLPKNSETR